MLRAQMGGKSSVLQRWKSDVIRDGPGSHQVGVIGVVVVVVTPQTPHLQTSYGHSSLPPPFLQ